MAWNIIKRCMKNSKKQATLYPEKRRERKQNKARMGEKAEFTKSK